ncbi:MAG: GNAT family N-acetyltransferase [Verrucomicrobiales bacterium]|nr:GNAT family N-acetyltransferase [Verrucomicrobiales bacterium]
MVSLREASEKDIDALHEIYSHETVSPNMGFDPCSRDEFEEIYREFSTAGQILVGEDHHGVMAVCLVNRRKFRLRHSAYVGSLAVHFSAQGSGVGREFFGSIIDQLIDEGFSRIELLVATDNKIAIEFFQKLGFEVEGTHIDYFSRAGSDSLFSEHTMALLTSRNPG